MSKLKIITSTVREGRNGKNVAAWVKKVADLHPEFETELIDLGEIELPLSVEPNHPVMKKYVYEYTKAWSRTVEEADAFIFILAEYNYSFPAAIKNAIDTVNTEWAYKPAGFVCYSAGIDGGARSMISLEHTISALKMITLQQEALLIPNYFQYLDDATKAFDPGERYSNNLSKLVVELKLWVETLAHIRKVKTGK